jgi:class 3 adenylate cyclase/pimeloyl-ACP methyl ester carboxylesterase
MGPPEIRYLQRDGKDFAYQVVGRGAQNAINVLEMATHLDLLWADPSWGQQWARFEDLWRVALFQARGVGLSEPVDRLPTLEQQAGDIEAVMDAAGMPSAIVYSTFTSAASVLMFAASRPDRVEALVLLDPLVSGPLASDPDLTGWAPGEAEAFTEGWLRAGELWGSGESLRAWDPVIVSPRTLRQMGLLERTGISPAGARAYTEAALRIDVSRIVSEVRVPVHVLHMPTGTMPEAVARHVAELLPSGEFHALAPSEHGMSLGETIVPIFEHVITMFAGHAVVRSDRRLATVLFEDVVGSTEIVTRMGDAKWRNLRVRRDRLRDTCVEEHGGEVISTAGDGSMSIFPGPAAAVRCAARLHERARTLDLQLRVGIHTGECERVGNDLAGLAVHIASRIATAADPGETLVSRAVSDLAAGSGLSFRPKGAHRLKGVSESWDLLTALPIGTAHQSTALTAAAPRAADRMMVATARRSPRLLRALGRLDQARARRQRR